MATHPVDVAGVQWESLHRGFLATPGTSGRPLRHLFEEHTMKTTTKFAAITLATLSIGRRQRGACAPWHGHGLRHGPGGGLTARRAEGRCRAWRQAWATACTVACAAACTDRKRRPSRRHACPT
ncbi:MAG: hypothetical protein MZU91_12420 [Desulfosudis oleivorans]|nr:hypothetical protein [Desulfosudis oleivorans]